MFNFLKKRDKKVDSDFLLCKDLTEGTSRAVERTNKATMALEEALRAIRPIDQLAELLRE